MGCLNESGVSRILGEQKVAQVEEQIRSLVLATDITRQNEFLDQLKVRFFLFFNLLTMQYLSFCGKI